MSKESKKTSAQLDIGSEPWNDARSREAEAEKRQKEVADKVEKERAAAAAREKSKQQKKVLGDATVEAAASARSGTKPITGRL